MAENQKIFAAICAAQEEIKSIGKDRTNTSQSYNFRGIDDVYNYIQPIFAKHGIFSVPTVLDDQTEERQTRNGANLIYRKLRIEYAFYAADGSCVRAIVIGEGMDSGDKASNKAMAVAHKYALLQVFAIPTQEPKDPENDSHEVLSVEEMKARKKIRADVAKALLDVYDEKSYGILMNGFKTKYPNLWSESTVTRAGETFASLFDERNRAVMRIRARRDEFLQAIRECTTLERVLKAEAKAVSDVELDCNEIADLIFEKKTELGWMPEGE